MEPLTTSGYLAHTDADDGSLLSILDPRALLRLTAIEEEFWGTLEQDCLWLVSAKNNKSVFDWSIQVQTRAGERAACLACERVFP